MYDQHDFKHLLISTDERVVTVTLNRPEVYNAVNDELHTDLARLASFLRRDRESRAIVLTGQGRAFCAGGDASFFATASTDEIEVLFDEGRAIVLDLLEVRQPIIAAVNGPAIGFGATLALLSDVVIAADDATFGDPHVGMGVVAGDGGTVIWPWLVGISRAKEYLMTGRSMPAAEAERIGLINHVVASDELLPAAYRLARELANGPARAIQGTKLALNQILRHTASANFDLALSLERDTMASADHREAVQAFLEGRGAQFTGQ